MAEYQPTAASTAAPNIRYVYEGDTFSILTPWRVRKPRASLVCDCCKWWRACLAWLLALLARCC
jgi:hypothetical protein